MSHDSFQCWSFQGNPSLFTWSKFSELLGCLRRPVARSTSRNVLTSYASANQSTLNCGSSIILAQSLTRNAKGLEVAGNPGRRKWLHNILGQDWLNESYKRRRRVSWFYQEDKQALSSSSKLIFRMLGVWFWPLTENEVSDSAQQAAVYYDNAGFLQARGPYITQGLSHHPQFLLQLIQHPRWTSPS